MPEDNVSNMPDESKGGARGPPTNPVEFSRWVQRSRVDPKSPKAQSDDPAMRLKPRTSQRLAVPSELTSQSGQKKKPNQTRLQAYLRPNKGLKMAPLAIAPLV